MLDGEPLLTPAGFLCVADVASVLLGTGEVLYVLAITHPEDHMAYVARLPWRLFERDE